MLKTGTVTPTDEVSGSNPNCCPSTSPSSSLHDQNSSIYWDGVGNRGTGSGSLMPNDTYF